MRQRQIQRRVFASVSNDDRRFIMKRAVTNAHERRVAFSCHGRDIASCLVNDMRFSRNEGCYNWTNAGLVVRLFIIHRIPPNRMLAKILCSQFVDWLGDGHKANACYAVAAAKKEMAPLPPAAPRLRECSCLSPKSITPSMKSRCQPLRLMQRSRFWPATSGPVKNVAVDRSSWTHAVRLGAARSF